MRVAAASANTDATVGKLAISRPADALRYLDGDGVNNRRRGEV